MTRETQMCISSKDLISISGAKFYPITTIRFILISVCIIRASNRDGLELRININSDFLRVL